jgi:uncharacterized protein (TIRG00374 family)
VDRRNVLATLVGFAVAAAVLGVLAAVVGVADVLAALGRADAGYVALVAGAVLAWLCLWGGTLRVVVAAEGGEIGVVDAVLVNAGAAFANHVTPFGQAGGEPVAAWLLSDVAEVDYERAFAAVASFDAINVVPSLSFAALGLGYYATVATLEARVRLVGAGVAAIAVALAAAVYVGWRHRATAERVLARLVAPPARLVGRAVPRLDPPGAADIEAHVEEFAAGIERVASDRERLALAVGLSASGWLVQAAGLWFALQSLGAAVPPYVPLFVVPMGTAAGALPTPGGLGGIETVQVTLLAATGVAAATATAAVAIFSVGGFLLTTTVGAAATAALQARGLPVVSR